MGYDQTACLVALAQFAAEGHTRGYRKCRNLNENAKRIDKNEEYEEDSKINLLRMRWKFYSRKGMINHKFSNKNQLVWILNAKDIIKTI